MSQLDEELRAEVEEALGLVDSRTLTAKGVSAALKSREVDISPQTLRRHHKGECSCEPR